MYTVMLNNQEIRDDLHKFLLNKKIFSKVYFNPIHLTKFYQDKFNTNTNNLPITLDVSNKVLTLPLYPNMTHEEKIYLVNSIFEYFESKSKLI